MLLLNVYCKTIKINKASLKGGNYNTGSNCMYGLKLIYEKTRGGWGHVANREDEGDGKIKILKAAAATAGSYISLAA